MKSLYVKVSQAVLILASVFATTPVLAAADVLDFLVLGQGSVVSDCSLVPVMLQPDCNVVLSGQASGTHIGHDDFSLTLRVGSTSGRAPNGAGGFCAAVTGFGSFTPPSTDTSISFNVAGSVCEESGSGSPAHFNGTYRITGGTARFANAVGGGSLTSTYTRGAGGVVFLHLHGTINF